MSAIFEARFPGRCAQGDYIEPGESIRYGEQNTVEHVECPDPTAVAAAKTDRPSRFEGTSIDEMGY